MLKSTGLVLGALLVLPLSAPAVTAAEISWRVVAPFRLFPEKNHDVALRRFVVAPAAALSPVLTSEKILSDPHSGDIWALRQKGNHYFETRWDRTARRPLDELIAPRSYKVRAVFKDEGAAASCTWTFRDEVSGKTTTTSAPCRREIEIEVAAKGNENGGVLAVRPAGASADAASARVHVKDLLIVGLGDSFSSGEGNPDEPASYDPEKEAQGERVRLNQGPARWLDRQCHRSLYSHQARAAMQLAVGDPHMAVSFFSYACSGATIMKGLLGSYKGVDQTDAPAPDADRSQIDMLVSHLCTGKITEVRLAERDSEGKRVRHLACETGADKRPRFKRQIDYLVMSVGGNDAGFAKVIASLILEKSDIRGILADLIGYTLTPAEAYARLETRALDHDYRLLRRVVAEAIQPRRTFILTYPNPFIGEDGELCGSRGTDILALKAIGKLARIDPEETESAYEKLLKPLNDKIRLQATGDRPWRVVDAPAAYGSKGVKDSHGWCASHDPAGPGIERLDQLVKGSNGWVPYSPLQLQPYTLQQRWMRTPNDAQLFTNLLRGVQYLVRDDLSPRLQKALLVSINGAFHPNALGQAAMADALLSALIAEEAASPR